MGDTSPILVGAEVFTSFSTILAILGGGGFVMTYIIHSCIRMRKQARLIRPPSPLGARP
jgi:uncharacterized membrane protein YciS (DUF1049 family)